MTRSKDAGLTLVELAVAVLVLAIGSIAAIRAMDQSRIAIGGAQDRALAQLVARNRAEELRLFGTFANLPTTVDMAGQTFDLSRTQKSTAAGLSETTIVATSQSGAGAVFVLYLPTGPTQ
jgi:general secretion pathway protein I